MTDRYEQTPSQTIGPFFGFALPFPAGSELVPGHHPDAIRLHGTVTDGLGDPVVDAMIEIWQSDAAGILSRELGAIDRDGFTFTGFGRTGTTLAGDYTFTTVLPGSVSGARPYILFTVFARGLTHHLFTRAYFPQHAGFADAVLDGIADDRRGTLVATADGLVGGSPSYRFDLRLQGEGETVFLDFDA